MNFGIYNQLLLDYYWITTGLLLDYYWYNWFLVTPDNKHYLLPFQTKI